MLTSYSLQQSHEAALLHIAQAQTLQFRYGELDAAAREGDPTYWQAYEAEARALEAMGDSSGAAQVRSLARGEQRR